MAVAGSLRRRLAWLANPILITSALIAAVALAWWGHSAINFGYPLLYDALAIDEHIAEYGPQNRYRDGFETTSRQQHLRLFAGIVEAVNNGGAGLAELTYRAEPDNRRVPLLRKPEITHLRAVASLVSLIHWAGITALAVFLATLAAMRLAGVALWRRAPLLGFVPVLVLALAAVIVTLDTRDDGWYAWFHDQAFGPGHQWFFYYQESLMTTLLKAPDLFAPLGASLGVTGIVCYALLCWLARRALRQRG